MFVIPALGWLRQKDREIQRQSLSQMLKGKTLTHWLGVYLALRFDLSTTHKTKLFSYAFLLLLFWSYARFKLFLGHRGGTGKEYINSKSLAEERGPFLLVNFTSYKKQTESLTFPIYHLALCELPQRPKDQALLVGSSHTHSTLCRSHCVKSRPWTALTSGSSYYAHLQRRETGGVRLVVQGPPYSVVGSVPRLEWSVPHRLVYLHTSSPVGGTS